MHMAERSDGARPDRGRARTVRRALVTLAAVALTSTLLPAGAVGAEGTAPVIDRIEVHGRGWGHGRGLGQYGALGYAVDHGWDRGRILDHFYGSTRGGQVDPNREIRVRLVRFDDRETIVGNERGVLTTNVVPGAFVALRVGLLPGGGYQLFSGPSCAGPWTDLGVSTAGPILFATDPRLLDSPNPADHVSVCEADGSLRAYRGTIAAVRDLNGAARTINVLPLDRYLRGVVPRESPASWADLGGGRGRAALEAQAVAARSYAVAENRYSYAQTCDTASCQVYGGVGLRNTAGVWTLHEDARTDAAIAATAGEVRVLANGNVARTEFSSSTGGHTAGGDFPAVPDAGDAIALNPNHTWTTQLTASAISTAFPEIGTFRSLDVLKRNGLGDMGGRVVAAVVRGSAGAVEVTGDRFRSATGIKSDWFRVPSVLAAPAVAVARGRGEGYWIATADGGVYDFNGAGHAGSMAGVKLNQPVVAITPNANGDGYWLLGRDGGVFSFNSPFYGSTGHIRLNQPVVGLTARPQGDGYWFVASDGGVFAFGAPFLGSTGDRQIPSPVVGMTVTPSGNGYWLFDGAGRLYPFGDAPNWSPQPAGLARPVVAFVVRPTGGGGWLVTDDGTLHAVGGAPALALSSPPPGPVVGAAATATGNGVRVITADGSQATAGDAR